MYLSFNPLCSRSADDIHTTFVNGINHINGWEGLWSFAKERLLKYHGVSKQHFFLYLKEMEFRHNFGIIIVKKIYIIYYLKLALVLILTNYLIIMLFVLTTHIRSFIIQPVS